MHSGSRENGGYLDLLCNCLIYVESYSMEHYAPVKHPLGTYGAMVGIYCPVSCLLCLHYVGIQTLWHLH